jgi:hypothetical protein
MATSSVVGTDKVDLLALDTGSLAVRAHVALPFTRASGVAVAAGSVYLEPYSPNPTFGRRGA